MFIFKILFQQYVKIHNPISNVYDVLFPHILTNTDCYQLYKFLPIFCPVWSRTLFQLHVLDKLETLGSLSRLLSTYHFFFELLIQDFCLVFS